MSPTQHQQVKSPLRFCASCAVTLGFWSVWIVLSVLLVSMVYVATAREFPVPGFVLRRIESGLAASNIALRFERVRLDPTGRILLENASLRMAQFEEPLLVGRQVFVESSPFDLLVGSLVPDVVRLDGASLQLPAVVSPSGTPESLVSDLAGTIRYDSGTWKIDQLSFQSGSFAVSVHGTYKPTGRREAVAPTLEDLATLLVKSGPQLALQLEASKKFSDPILVISLKHEPDTGNTAEITLTARELEAATDGRTVKLRNVVASGSLGLDGDKARNLVLSATVGRAESTDAASANDLRVAAQLSVNPAGWKVAPIEVSAAAGKAVFSGETVDAPLVRANLARMPEISLAASLAAKGGVYQIGFDGDATGQCGRLAVSGRATPALVNDLLTRRAARAAPFLVLKDPVDFDVTATFAPGWEFDRLAGRVAGGALDSQGVAITAAKGRIEFDGRSFLASDAVLFAGDNVARGSYWMDTVTRDSRILLSGRLRPMEISGWFRRDWWKRFWGDFEFPVTPPEADVDIVGRWGDARQSANFIRASARSPVIRGVGFDSVRTLVFTRPTFLHLLDLDATRADGSQEVSGTFKRWSDFGDPAPRESEFDLSMRLESEAIELLTRGGARPILEQWRFTEPPRFDFRGRWTAGENRGHTELTYTGSAQGGVWYFGFPLDSVDVSGAVSGNRVSVDRFKVDAAGGTGEGSAALDGPREDRRLDFRIAVKNAELGHTVQAVQIYDAARTGRPVQPAADNRFIQRAGNARLDFALDASGRPGDVGSFRGSGNAQLTGATLSQIHLFGLLSQVLSGLSLNFSTLKLSTVRSNFTLADGRLNFPDLRVSGSSAVIEGRADYTLRDSAVNFTGRFRPYGEQRNIFTGTLGIVLNPLTSIVELKMSGPLRAPQLTYSIGQSVDREREAPAPAADPAAPRPAPGSATATPGAQTRGTGLN